MFKVKIIAMGKLTVPYLKDASADYVKRIGRSFSISVVEPKPEALPQAPSAGEIERALEREAERILAEIPPRARVYAMCVEGKPMSSEKLAESLERCATETGEACFIVGSSHGMHDKVKARADVRLSVSPMTFPHELFRVMLLEQIYRAAEIQSGSRYHK